MKKTTLLLCSLFAMGGFAQQKSTGMVDLLSNTKANLLLDAGTNTATLTLVGPNDRWFALQFGSFEVGDGMAQGQDVVYWNNVAVVDCVHNDIGVMPTIEGTNSWTTVSNNDNTPSAGLRTVVATRALNTGDANDYAFNFSNTTIDFAFSRRSNAGYTLNSHGFSNRGYLINVPLTPLGVEDFSLNASTIFPNPSNGNFTVKAKANLEKINVYSQTGAFIKTIDADSNEVEVKLNGLATGVYLIELQNATEKSWKKIIIK